MQTGVTGMKKVRMGMIGGGHGAFIGEIHRAASALDGQIELVCGAFSSNAERSRLSGLDLGLSENRIYATYQDMCTQEALLPEDERMEFVCIVTPNHLHFPAAKVVLESGFHVMLDKPATLNLPEALELKKVVEASGKLLGLTHTYLGYPMVKQARHMVQSGKLGKIRKVLVEYPQGWLSQPDGIEGNKQAEWRTDPKRSGPSGCMGDIGTHAHNMAEYVSGQIMTHVCAYMRALEGRTLDDDGAALFKMDGGATGVLTASQICTGEENAMNIRVYGEKGGLEWHQQEPNSLQIKMHDEPVQIMRAGGNVPYLCEAAIAACRTPAGHPEGFIEAFANLYKNFADMIRRYPDDLTAEDVVNVPGIDEGIRGMAFVEAMVESGRSETKWYPVFLA